MNEQTKETTVSSVRLAGRGWGPAVEPRRILASRGDLDGADGADSGSDAESTEAWARELLQAAHRTESNPLRKQRVWRALAQAPVRRGLPIWRTAVAVGVLVGTLGGAAFASAALGYGPEWAVRAYERLVSRSPFSAAASRVASDVGSSGHRSSRRHLSAGDQSSRPGVEQLVDHQVDRQVLNGDLAPGKTDVAPAPAPADLVAPAPELRVPTATGLPGHPRHGVTTPAVRVPRHLAVATATSDPKNYTTNDDDRPVLTALRALRRDKDPDRARSLLDRYLSEHPRGTLAEEALALSIEAAVAQHDIDARILARRYLETYPSGPFRSVAEQALGSGRATSASPPASSVKRAAVEP